MKILVLMPLDEKSVYMANKLFVCLTPEVQLKCFNMPGFMEYLVLTEQAPNYEWALVDAMFSAKKVYEASKDDDLIIFGNICKDCKFDAIFNCQDLNEDLPYSDLLLAKMQEKSIDEPIIMQYIEDVYINDDSKMPLHNAEAAGQFISDYLDSEVHPITIPEKVGLN